MIDAKEIIRGKREAMARFSPGERVDCEIITVRNKTKTTTRFSSTIGSVSGGGFYGNVLVFPDDKVVMKLSQPDPWHEFWRYVNWEKPFPPQVSEVEALHDHLSSRIIANTIEYVSKVKIPAPVGYTHFEKLGYAQEIEQAEGRPIRFSPDMKEFKLIRRTQDELLKIGSKFGLEHISQIHPANPFAFSNLWIDENGKVIWLDTLPAIPHTGFVKPFFRFPFHLDIRRRLGTDEVTFNRIHTARFREMLKETSRLFPGNVYNSLIDDLGLYESVVRECGQSKHLSKKEDFLEACFETGLITTSQKEFLLNSDKDYNKFASELKFEPLVEAFTVGVAKLMDLANPVRHISTLYKIITDGSFKRGFVRSIILSGVTQASERRILSSKDLNRISTAIDKDTARGLAYLDTQAYFLLSGRLMNFVEGSSYLSVLLSGNKEAKIAFGFFIGWILPSLVRPLITTLMGRKYNVDLKHLKSFSKWPKVGSYLSVPYDISKRGGNDDILHYNLRLIVASISSILRPWGGWGSQHEAQLWNVLADFHNFFTQGGVSPKLD